MSSSVEETGPRTAPDSSSAAFRIRTTADGHHLCPIRPAAAPGVSGPC
ncbi:hypothetical protein [Streptomyces sp. NPDC012450]